MRVVANRFRFVVPVLVAVMASPAAALPPTAPAAHRFEPQNTESTDVTLTADGLLVGQLVDQQGVPVGEAKVQLFSPAGEPIAATTNERGQFGYRGVASGVYYLQAGDQVRLARVWEPSIAPPSAQAGVLLVRDAGAVRAQHAAPPAVNNLVQTSKHIWTNPLAVAGIVATAVAIPVAVANADDGS